ncbi:MAG: hypothetical protein ACYCU7_18785 [Acidimicrobiales bacterium]
MQVTPLPNIDDELQIFKHTLWRILPSERIVSDEDASMLASHDPQDTFIDYMGLVTKSLFSADIALLNTSLNAIITDDAGAKTALGILAALWHGYLHRNLTKVETRRLVNSLAEKFENYGVPKTLICKFIWKLCPYKDPRYVQELLPKQYKEQEMSRRGSMTRRTSSPETTQDEPTNPIQETPYYLTESYPLIQILEAGEEAILSDYGSDVQLMESLSRLRNKVQGSLLLSEQ